VKLSLTRDALIFFGGPQYSGGLIDLDSWNRRGLVAERAQGTQRTRYFVGTGDESKVVEELGSFCLMQHVVCSRAIVNAVCEYSGHRSSSFELGALNRGVQLGIMFPCTRSKPASLWLNILLTPSILYHSIARYQTFS